MDIVKKDLGKLRRRDSHSKQVIKKKRGAIIGFSILGVVILALVLTLSLGATIGGWWNSKTIYPENETSTWHKGKDGAKEFIEGKMDEYSKKDRTPDNVKERSFGLYVGSDKCPFCQTAIWGSNNDNSKINGEFGKYLNDSSNRKINWYSVTIDDINEATKMVALLFDGQSPYSYKPAVEAKFFDAWKPSFKDRSFFYIKEKYDPKENKLVYDGSQIQGDIWKNQGVSAPFFGWFTNGRLVFFTQGFDAAKNKTSYFQAAENFLINFKEDK